MDVIIDWIISNPFWSAGLFLAAWCLFGVSLRIVITLNEDGKT